jgi:uncharacterized protein (DUF362 family)
MLEPTQALTPEATPITMEMEPMMPDIGDDVPRAQVTLIKPEGRMTGVERALDMLGVDDFAGKRVLLKPNFNSADAPPASSHNDTIRALVQWLRSKGAEQITIADRSGMGITRRVMEDKGILDMAEELDLATIAFDELAADQWEMVQFAGSHWENGFPIAKPVLEADAVVSLCCLKTHRFGGHFSMALKNSVGVVASTIPGSIHDFMMSELHVSPHQRLMIAEINSAFTPELVLLDAMEAFANQGPEMGRLVSPGVIMAASDRIAIDAVGVAILRHYGTTNQVSQGSIFQLEQIARAVQLGLGVDRADKIDLLTEDTESSQFVDQILPILDAG